MLAERLHKTEAVLRARSQSFNGKGTITVMQWQGTSAAVALSLFISRRLLRQHLSSPMSCILFSLSKNGDELYMFL